MSPAPRLQIDGVVEARQGWTDGCCDFSSMEELDAGNTGRGLDLQIARSGQKRRGPVKTSGYPGFVVLSHGRKSVCPSEATAANSLTRAKQGNLSLRPSRSLWSGVGKKVRLVLAIHMPSDILNAVLTRMSLAETGFLRVVFAQSHVLNVASAISNADARQSAK